MGEVLSPQVVALLEERAMLEYERDHPLRPADWRGRPYAVWRAEEHASVHRDEMVRLMSEVPQGPAVGWS